MKYKSDTREIVALALPLILAAAATAVNGFTDGFFLARLSDVALRAALPANALAGAILSFFSGLIGYSGTLFARAHGGGRPADALAASLVASLLALLAFPILVALVPAAKALLGLFGHTPDVLTAERQLTSIILSGGVLQLTGLVGAGYFAGQGRTRLVGTTLIIGALAKIILTPLFIFGLPTHFSHFSLFTFHFSLFPFHFSLFTFHFSLFPSHGIAGAGYAFIAEHAIVTTIFLFVLLRDPLARTVPLRDLARRLGAAGRLLLSRGLPLGAIAVIGYATFFILTSLLARLDAAAAAASSAMMAINCPFNAVIVGFTQATEILVGRRSGANDARGVRSTISAALSLSVLLSALYVALLFLFGERLAACFLTADATLDRDVYASTIRALTITLALRIAFEFASSLLDAALRGLGRAYASSLAGLGITLLVWLPATAAAFFLWPTATGYWCVMALTSAVGFPLRWWLCARRSA